MKNMTLRITVVVVFLTMALFGMIAKKQWTLLTGTQILLETRPIDPRSLFRGDYVVLKYPISRLYLAPLSGDKKFQRHDPVYVALKKSDKYWQPFAVHRELVTVLADEVILRGKVRFAYGRHWSRHDDSQQGVNAHSLTIDYGIESYFVPEGEGRELERRGPNNKVDLLIAVDRYGNAGIKAVLVNDVERYRETLF